MRGGDDIMVCPYCGGNFHDNHDGRFICDDDSCGFVIRSDCLPYYSFMFEHMDEGGSDGLTSRDADR